jgi:hypothetical protein
MRPRGSSAGYANCIIDTGIALEIDGNYVELKKDRFFFVKFGTNKIVIIECSYFHSFSQESSNK